MKNLVAFVRILILTASIVTFYAPTVKAQDGIAKPDYLTQIEFDVLKELNKARTNPQQYSQFLEKFGARYIDEYIYMSPTNRARFRLQEGRRALQEAVRALYFSSPMNALSPSKGLTAAADTHVTDLSVSGITGHYGTNGTDPFQRMEQFGEWKVSAGECIQFGFNTAEEAVAMLIIDDGVADRGHRQNILNPEFHVVGISHGPHRVYRNMTVIDFAGGFQESVPLEAK